jgi:hypothetical protein
VGGLPAAGREGGAAPGEGCVSRKAAIEAKCKDCIWDPEEPGNWRQQAESCTITECSLHPYRPTLLRSGAILRHGSED